MVTNLEAIYFRSWWKRMPCYIEQQSMYQICLFILPHLVLIQASVWVLTDGWLCLPLSADVQEFSYDLHPCPSYPC